MQVPLHSSEEDFGERGSVASVGHVSSSVSSPESFLLLTSLVLFLLSFWLFGLMSGVFPVSSFPFKSSFPSDHRILFGSVGSRSFWSVRRPPKKKTSASGLHRLWKSPGFLLCLFSSISPLCTQVTSFSCASLLSFADLARVAEGKESVLRGEEWTRPFLVLEKKLPLPNAFRSLACLRSLFRLLFSTVRFPFLSRLVSVSSPTIFFFFLPGEVCLTRSDLFPHSS